MNLSTIIIIVLLLILIAAVFQIVFGEVLDGSYCATDNLLNGTRYLEYCLLNNKVISCTQNMTACIEVNKEIEK